MSRNTKNKNKYVPINHIMMQKRDQGAWKPTIHEHEAGTSRNPKRRTMKESGWETFILAKRNKLTWEK